MSMSFFDPLRGKGPSLERWFGGKLNRRQRAEFELECQHDPKLRVEYDHLFTFLRALDENLEVSPLELELVETRLFSDTPQSAEATAPEARTPTLIWVAALALVAAGLFLLLVPSLSGQDDESRTHGRGIAYVPPNTALGVGHGLVARGGLPGHGLAVEFFCATPALPILDERCALNLDLSFAFKVEPSKSGPSDPEAVLSLFGIDERGELMYYFPTPADQILPQVKGDQWTAVEHSVQLDVNHAPGRVRMFALWSPQAPKVADIDAFHHALKDQALDEHTSWTSRLPLELLQRICGPSDDCRTARSELLITAAGDSTSLPSSGPARK